MPRNKLESNSHFLPTIYTCLTVLFYFFLKETFELWFAFPEVIQLTSNIQRLLHQRKIPFLQSSNLSFKGQIQRPPKVTQMATLRVHTDKGRRDCYSKDIPSQVGLFKTKILIYLWGEVIHNLIFSKVWSTDTAAIEPDHLMTLSVAQKCPHMPVLIYADFPYSIRRLHRHGNAMKVEKE